MYDISRICPCCPMSPRSEKLKAAENLVGKFSLHSICTYLDLPRGTYYNYIKSKNPFSPQSKKYNHWANGEEVRQMPIAGGSFLALGSFDGRRLRLDKASSVLVWGASAQGKTSTVAIPSILESNTAAIVALDHEGSLADYTSGHRSGLGQIFYFDWSRTDNPSSGTYGPRWNPLSNKDMPDKNDKREAYLKKLAQHLLPFYG